VLPASIAKGLTSLWCIDLCQADRQSLVVYSRPAPDEQRIPVYDRDYQAEEGGGGHWLIARGSYLQLSKSVGLRNVMEWFPTLYSFRPVSLTIPCLLIGLSLSGFRCSERSGQRPHPAWRYLDQPSRA
jgi:hypothetical protein